MEQERSPEVIESSASMEKLFDHLIRTALSPVWAKTTQELLPGYLPDKPRGAYTKEELALYKVAYSLLGAMVKQGEVEVIIDQEAPDETLQPRDARPRFKLVTQHGKKSPSDGVVW